MENTMTNQTLAIIKWQYWLFNHGNPKQLLVDIFGSNLGLHFYSKFNHFCEGAPNTAFAWIELFMEMSTSNQAALANYVIKNYDGCNSLESLIEK